MKNSSVKIIALLLLYATGLSAQQVIALYPGKAPGSESWTWDEKENNKNLFNTRVVYNVSRPTITAYLPDPAKATGTAVIVAPGGGFHNLSIDSEGIDVAKWLNERGIAAFVLKYRLVHCLTDDPVQEFLAKMNSGSLDKESAPIVALAINDGLQAMKYVRSHAGEFRLNPKKIGFMGFSAGGTITMGVTFGYAADSRPDFLAPVYAYMGILTDKTIQKDAPPIFICAASDDQLGLATHSSNLYNDWIAAKKPAELHIYAKGGHGFGMRKQNLPTDQWIERFGEWLKVQGF